jgi:peptide chain release factor 1
MEEIKKGPTAEDRETTMGFGDVVDEFLNQHGLSDTSTSEKANLSTTGVGGKEVDDLNTGFQNLGSSGLVNEGRRVGMDGGKLDTLDWATLVNGLTNDVHDTAESGGTNRDHDGVASINDLGTTDETFCTVHGNGADRVLTKMGSDFKDKTATAEIHDLEGVEDRREVVGVKLDIDNGTNDGFY